MFVMIRSLEYIFVVIEKFYPKETCNFCVGTSNEAHDATEKPQCAIHLLGHPSQRRQKRDEEHRLQNGPAPQGQRSHVSKLGKPVLEMTNWELL